MHMLEYKTLGESYEYLYGNVIAHDGFAPGVKIGNQPYRRDDSVKEVGDSWYLR
jgi:hypothetical protein